jgi:hypothetical protein
MISGWTVLVAFLIFEIILLAALIFPVPKFLKKIIGSIFHYQKQYVAIAVVILMGITAMEWNAMSELEAKG